MDFGRAGWVWAVGIVVLGCARPPVRDEAVQVRDAKGHAVGVLEGGQVFVPHLGCELSLVDGAFYVPERKHVDVWWSDADCTGKPSVDMGPTTEIAGAWEGFPFACVYSGWLTPEGQPRRTVFRAVQPVRRTKVSVRSRANFRLPMERCVNFSEPKEVWVYSLERVAPEDLVAPEQFTFGK